MPHFRRCARAILLMSAAVLSACVSYDHSWIQNQQEKQRAVKRLQPATLGRRGQGSLQRRSAYVRAHVTRSYAAETLNWEARFDDLLRDTNEILEPVLGLHLENG